MEWIEFVRHWDSMCYLSEQLKATKNAVYHGLCTNEAEGLVHAKVYSEAFRQILMASSAEFECMLGELCRLKGENSKKLHTRIRTLLNYYPQITRTEVLTEFSCFCPLTGLDIIKDKGDNGDNVEKVTGLSWWEAYTAQKHDPVGSFEKATLDNALRSLASLYVIELYVLNELMGNILFIKDYPSCYFQYRFLEKTGNNNFKLPD